MLAAHRLLHDFRRGKTGGSGPGEGPGPCGSFRAPGCRRQLWGSGSSGSSDLGVMIETVLGGLYAAHVGRE